MMKRNDVIIDRFGKDTSRWFKLTGVADSLEPAVDALLEFGFVVKLVQLNAVSQTYSLVGVEERLIHRQEFLVDH